MNLRTLGVKYSVSQCMGVKKMTNIMVWQHCQYETLDVDMIHECTLADLTIVAPTGTLSSLSNTI